MERHEAFERRMVELLEIAKEEGIEPSSESAAQIRKFVVTFGPPIAVFLLDDGTYRGRWIVAGQGTSLAFRADGSIEAIHMPLVDRQG